MEYILGAIVGAFALGTLLWLSHRITLRLGSDKRDSLRTVDQSQSEAEFLARSRNPQP